jgi:ribosomal protein S16
VPRTDLYDDSGALHKDIKLDMLRARYWVGVGAQPSDPVWRLLAMVRKGWILPIRLLLSVANRISVY